MPELDTVHALLRWSTPLHLDTAIGPIERTPIGPWRLPWAPYAERFKCCTGPRRALQTRMRSLPLTAVDTAGTLRLASAHELAYRLDAHASNHWQALQARHGPRLARVFVARGSVAYDLYLRRLLAAPLDRLRSQQLQWYPRLPGGVAHSRMFVAGAGSYRERWLTVALCGPADTPLGMLVVAVQERLDRFEIARRPLVFALDSMGIAAVRAALRRDMSPPVVHTVPGRATELAYQRREAELIAEQEFFYDPAQLVAKEA